MHTHKHHLLVYTILKNNHINMVSSSTNEFNTSAKWEKAGFQNTHLEMKHSLIPTRFSTGFGYQHSSERATTISSRAQLSVRFYFGQSSHLDLYMHEFYSKILFWRKRCIRMLQINNRTLIRKYYAHRKNCTLFCPQ